MTDLATAALRYVRSDRPDLTLRQCAALGILCDQPGPHRTDALARALGVSKPIVTRIQNRFVELGWAVRIVEEDDRRRCHMVVTDAGRDVRDAMRDRSITWEESIGLNPNKPLPSLAGELDPADGA